MKENKRVVWLLLLHLALSMLCPLSVRNSSAISVHGHWYGGL
ncbi:hypothetical protein KC19_VG140800 [Ceratodon purpureus]|uniref:Uncharacterized protein n=1 Tax=Ceratodon purpureus TaxID=3225 RepID=A0A8T0HQ22_CERPU|nr:hypothetical protein KC19_VG140800 [Ceratodon purpureus]